MKGGLEWSGVLFYETEGTFGSDNFKAHAKELFFLDIGSGSYTEYDPTDAELIKYMMENPHVMDMKKGHIHSHHNMDVFFSGTDDSELIDNSEFHNFYLSLIVNNKNHMKAKIAFRATSTSEVKRKLVFRNENGEETTAETNGTKEENAVYAYDCTIAHEGGVDVEFHDRFLRVKRKKEKEEEEAKKKAKEVSKNLGAYGSFNVDERWREAGLFDEFAAANQSHYGKGKNKSKKSNEVGKWEIGHERGEVDFLKKSTMTTARISSMLSKLLSLDYLNEDGLGVVIKRLNGTLYGKNPVSPAAFFDTILKKSTEFYLDTFKEDYDYKFFDETMESCISILEVYEDTYPELIIDLSEALNITLK